MSTEVDKVRTELTSWARVAVRKHEAKGVYVFGSLVYKDGAQFMASSDADLVVLMPDGLCALERWRWLQQFAEWVNELEVRLMKALRRSGTEPSVSVVAVTETELAYDVHKDGHREFFTSNVFRDLESGADLEGLTGAGAKTTDRFTAGALAFAQKLRNDFLAVSANGTPRLQKFDGPDPLPKRVMRAAAMAARASGVTTGPGAEHDVQAGLDLLSDELYERRGAEPPYRQLQDVISVRRHGRGEHRPIDAASQLLLAEMIYDVVAGAGPASARHSDDPVAAQEQGTRPVASPRQSEPSDLAQGGRNAEPVSGRMKERMGSSTAFFASRFADAFPGVRTTEWFTEQADIEQRMLALLRAPLAFADGNPIWYWRGGNLHIEDFKRTGPGHYLMDADELRIARIAAVPGSTPKHHFVYVRCDAMEPTGVYRGRSTSDLAAAVEQNGYDYEEYGLVAGVTPVKRAEYDDGSALMDGKLIDISGKSKLRIRYTTPYNFLIAANGSPINNADFDDTLVAHLNVALQEPGEEEAVVGRLKALVQRLPIRSEPEV